MTESPALLDCKLYYMLDTRRLWQFASDRHFRTARLQLLNCLPDIFDIDVEMPQDDCGNALPLFHQSEQNMLRPDELILAAPRNLLGQVHHRARAFAESLEHTRVSDGHDIAVRWI